MRPDTDILPVTGDLGGQTTVMSVDQESLVHIQSILTKLYSNTELAVVRELASNAWDSHVEAGNNDPIAVSVPGPLGNYFIVQDWGVGMSPADLENIFSKYGASTKRHSNDYVGMLGLGCKSPLAYNSNFDIVAIKNGIQTKAIVSLNAEGIGEISIIDTQATTEPNGVTIKVPAKTGHSFSKTAKNFFKFWPQGTVLVNGQEPANEFEELLPNVRMEEIDYWGDNSSVIVMGNVPYPVKGYFDWVPRGRRLIIDVPIGTVKPTPSREDLDYNDRTIKALATLSDDIQLQLTRVAKDKINAIADKPAKYKEYANVWKKFLGHGAAADLGLEESVAVDLYEYREGSNHYETNLIYLSSFYDPRYKTFARILVKGIGDDAITTYKRRKLLKWAEQNNMPGRYSNMFFLTREDSIPGDGWLEFDHVIDWSDVMAIKLDSNKRAGGGTRDTYLVLGQGSQTPVGDINAKRAVIFAKGDYRARVIKNNFPDVAVVVEPRNRHNKFIRLFDGEVVDATELVEEYKKELIAKLTDADRRLLSGHRNTLPNYDPNRIDDKELVAKLEEFAGDKPSATYKKVREFNNNLSAWGEINVPWVQPLENPLQDFPLLSSMTYGTLENEHYEYINALSAYRKDK